MTYQHTKPDFGTWFLTIPLISFWSSAAKISSSTISNPAVETGSNFSFCDASQTSLNLSGFSLLLDESHNSADQLSGREQIRTSFKLCASSSISSNVFASLSTQQLGVTSFLACILWHHRTMYKKGHRTIQNITVCQPYFSNEYTTSIIVLSYNVIFFHFPFPFFRNKINK